MLDIDGVVAYWEKAAAETCGVDYKDQKIRDAIKNGKRLETYVGGDDKMWPIIDKEGEKWWEDLERLSWADDLINLLKKETKDLAFLSSPSKNPICYSGKIKWVLKHYPKMSREYGGHAFLWPCPLSLIDGDVDIEDIFKELKDSIKDLKK